MSENRGAEPDRSNSFDAVRLIAALTVLLAHQQNIAGYTLAGYGQPSLGPFGPKLADAGLYVFFALSGYLVYQSLDADPRAARFLSSRALRIYPGAVVNTVACLLFGAAVTTLSVSAYWGDPETRRYLFHNVAILFTPTQFQLPAVLAESRWPAVDVPIWTLKYEILCYLVLLVAYKLIGPRPCLRRACFSGSALVWTAAFVVQRAFPALLPSGADTLASFSGVHVIRFFMVFFSGAAYAASGPSTGAARAAAAAVLVSAIAFIPVTELRFTLTTLLIGFTAIEIGRSRLLFSHAYRRCGDLSYGTYLYAFPIQMLTLSRWLDASNFWWLTLVDVAVALVCAVLSWHLVERPALRLKRGRRERDAPRRSPSLA
ncbi:acyltransferase [Lichenibacterium minor]|uniref:Acyltransferase n=1 Tax=Lichenibacterium minor TaxID=2316528 RepID=A0A4Q2U155_9HYPH|nr:acyltransferase [Lichenibacterium minor]RYC30002.1 acyltransferase [Lichenibacterium minor]